jgi:16S rRNA processing protein RimM
MGGARRVVGRLRKPHGLKGDCAVFPLTDAPERVFAAGSTLWVVDLNGDTVAGPLEVSHSRAYHREWLVAFRGMATRTEVEHLGGGFLAVPQKVLEPPGGNEVYLDELPGFAVIDSSGASLGLVTGWYDLPGGLALEVQGPKREFLIPFRKEWVVRVDRENRRFVVDVPEGLTDL